MHGRDHRPGGEDPIPGVGSPAWAILYGTQFKTGGSSSATIAASATGIPEWTNFTIGGEPGVFATHNAGVRPSYPIPDASGFHNTTGDEWIFTVKPGTIIAYFDSMWGDAGGWPLRITRDDGDSTYQGGENFGPQGWWAASGGTANFSYSFIRPLDNDPGDEASDGGQGLYYVFSLNVQNLDTGPHTLDGSNNLNLYIQWWPIVPGVITDIY